MSRRKETLEKSKNYTDAERKKYLQAMDVQFMSSETEISSQSSSDENSSGDGEPVADAHARSPKFLRYGTKSMEWRSKELNELFNNLDLERSNRMHTRLAQRLPLSEASSKSKTIPVPTTVGPDLEWAIDRSNKSKTKK